MVDIKRTFVSLSLIVFLAINAPMVFADDVKVIAYYFHGNARCSTCHKMELYTNETIEQNFEEELANGLLVVKTVNIEKKENEHFVNDYQLYTKSLVISRVEKGREVQYKNLTKIWEYVRDKKRFFKYVTAEINNYLKDKQ